MLVLFLVKSNSSRLTKLNFSLTTHLTSKTPPETLIMFRLESIWTLNVMFQVMLYPICNKYLAHHHGGQFYTRMKTRKDRQWLYCDQLLCPRLSFMTKINLNNVIDLLLNICLNWSWAITSSERCRSKQHLLLDGFIWNIISAFVANQSRYNG